MKQFILALLLLTIPCFTWAKDITDNSGVLSITQVDITDIIDSDHIIYAMHYREYYFDPCKCDEHGNCTCYAISGYDVPAKIVYCDNIKQVEDQLNKTGVEHLGAIYKIQYTSKKATVKEVKVKYKATIEQDNKW